MKELINYARSDDDKLLSDYISFLEYCNELYLKGPAKVRSGVLKEINKFVEEYVPDRIRKHQVTSFAMYMPHLVTVTREIERVNDIPHANYKIRVTSSFLEEAFTSVLDSLILSHKYRKKLQLNKSEEEIKKIINKFKQKNPGAKDSELVSYLINSIIPYIKEYNLENLPLSKEQETTIRNNLTPEEVQEVLDQYVEKDSMTVQGLLTAIHDKIRANRQKRTPEILKGLKKLTPDNRKVLENYFSDEELSKIAQRFKHKHKISRPTNDQLAHLFNMIADHYMEYNFEIILRALGEEKFNEKKTKVDYTEDDVSEYYRKGPINPYSDSENPFKRIPTTVYLDNIPADIEIEKPEDLFKGIQHYVSRARYFVEVSDYKAWYVTPGVANFVAFNKLKFPNLDPIMLLDKNEVPTIVKYIPKTSTIDDIIMSPYMLGYITKTFDANYIKNKTSNRKLLQEFRLAAKKFKNTYKKYGMYVIWFDHRRGNKNIVPFEIQLAKPNEGNLRLPPTVPSKDIVSKLEGLEKL